MHRSFRFHCVHVTSVHVAVYTRCVFANTSYARGVSHNPMWEIEENYEQLTNTKLVKLISFWGRRQGRQPLNYILFYCDFGEKGLGLGDLPLQSFNIFTTAPVRSMETASARSKRQRPLQEGTAAPGLRFSWTWG